MAKVPVIESPCPVVGKGLPAGATEHCTLCDRSVHNLDRMSAGQRREFMRSCSGKVCVAYTVKIPVRHRGLVAASIAAAALVSLPAAAEDPAPQAEPPAGAMSPATPDQYPHCDDYYEEILVGGVSHGDQAEWTDDGKDAPPELPTIEDDGR
ncbi:MAG TPA: hypothetical protein VJP84_07920 [Steroidobacteraceae bacterium]|jgi:hypothetical protein|nr:hypothetical protein [Steroidobacteraceae bacterium]